MGRENCAASAAHGRLKPTLQNKRSDLNEEGDQAAHGRLKPTLQNKRSDLNEEGDQVCPI